MPVEMMLGDEARMKAEFFGLDVSIDDPLGAHRRSRRHLRRAARTRRRTIQIAWENLFKQEDAGGGSRHRRIN